MWMTKKKINNVRNKLIGLCMKPGQSIKVAAPAGEKYFAIPFVEISVSNGSPLFRYQEMGTNLPERVYVLTKEGINCRIGGFTEDFEWLQLPYRSKACVVPWKLIKAYASHFPFVPSDNYFQNNGNVIV